MTYVGHLSVGVSSKIMSSVETRSTSVFWGKQQQLCGLASYLRFHCLFTLPLVDDLLEN